MKILCHIERKEHREFSCAAALYVTWIDVLMNGGKMTNLSNHLNELDAARKLLRQRWLAAGEVWNDRVYQEFADQYWQPLEQQSAAVAASLERLAQVVNKARQVVK